MKSICIALVLGSLCSSLVRAQPRGNAATEPWTELKSEHFTAYGQVPERQIRETLSGLERFRAALAGTTGLTLASSRPIYLYLFRSTEVFLPYTRSNHRAPRGYFVRGMDGDYVAIVAFSPTEAARTLYHEYVHGILAATFPAVPVWLDEGLAEFYSSFRLNGNDAETGRPLESHVRWLGSHPLIPLETLFATTHDSAEYNEDEKVGVFYAESWALVHMLLRGEPALRSKSGRFLGALLDGSTAEAASRSAFGIGVADLEERLKAYAKQSEYTYTATSLEGLSEAAFGDVRPMSPAEVWARLGDLLAVPRRSEAAEASEKHYRAALALDPACARAHAGLALLRAREGRQDDAVALYDRALAADPKDPAIALLAGLNLLSKTQKERAVAPGEARSAADVLRARALLERSIALSPDNADAFAAAGMTYVLEDGDPDAGIRLLREARSRMPGRAEVVANLMILACRKGDRAVAEESLDRLKRIGSAEQIEMGWEMWSRFELRDANEAVHKGELDRALEILRGIDTTGLSPSSAASLRDRIAEVEAAVVEKKEVDAYNAAIRLYKAGKVSAARKALQMLLVDCRSHDLCEAARERLARLN
jgi:tetratricopeptide (TPR) repeat protein